MMLDPKKGAALIVAGLKIKGQPDAAADSRAAFETFAKNQAEASTEPDDALTAAAQTLLTAVSASDVSGIVRAFKAMWTLCDAAEYSVEDED